MPPPNAPLVPSAHPRRTLVRFRVLNPIRYVIDNVCMAFEPGLKTGAKSCRVLLVSDAKIITSEQQLQPFFAYRSDLRRRLKVVSLHVLLEDVLRLPRFAFRSFDMIAFKLSFRMSATVVAEVRRAISAIAGARPVIYLDGDDDLCIMHPDILSWVTLYVKKHAFRDRSRYLHRFVGKSNLTDFVHREYGCSFADDPVARESQAVDSTCLNKIIVGWNVALDRNMAALYSRAASNSRSMNRTVDIMFRGSVPKDWLYYLRKDVEPSLNKMRSVYKVIIPRERVSQDEYYREMMTSKICISPFGYGEICWRDMEAIMCGCLLVKPDMSHVETIPNVFRAFETYVPVRWDYADLEEKCAYYLSHDDERERIAFSALEVLENYHERKEFLTTMSELLNRIRTPGSARTPG